MEWFFGALLFLPVILIAFVIMRVDLLLHFIGQKDPDRMPQEQKPEPAEGEAGESQPEKQG